MENVLVKGPDTNRDLFVTTYFIPGVNFPM